MWQRIEESTGDARLRDQIARIYRDYQLPARDVTGLAKAVQHFIQHTIKYVREQPETLASAFRTLDWRIGDCDDMTILACALLRGCRVPCRAVFTGWTKEPAPARIALKHVYPEAYLPEHGWTALECVRPVRLGWRADDWKRSEGFRTRTERIGDPAP